MIPGNINTDLISGAEGAYQVERSLRFNSADSAFLSRTPASAGNRKTWTWSGWVKRSGLGAGHLFVGYVAGNDNQILEFRFSSDKLHVAVWTTQLRVTTQVFRDIGAWAHVVLAVDTTQAVANDRVKLYWNGAQITQFDTTNNPAQNADLGVNQAGLHTIGREWTSTSTLNGYLADIHFIDGQALTPSSFAETNATTGQWVPKAYIGSYGTNGFRLDFSNPFDLGNDAAGANDWTPNNLSGVSGGPTSVAAASGALPVYNTTDTYGATKGTGTRTDSNSSSIVLAIPMDGANNGTTFTDESATIKGSGSAKTITLNGAPITSTAISKYYGSSGYFNGSSYLTLPSGSDFVFTGNFTVECWAYPTSISSVLDGLFSLSVLADWNNVEANGNTGLVLSVGALHWGNSTSQNYATGSIRVNSWTHLAVSRSGSTITVYINGASALSVSYSGTIGNSATQTPGIGRFDGRGGGRFPFTGYIQDLRVYNGIAKYTSSFIPPNNPQQAALIGAGNDSLVDTPTSYGTDTGAGGEVRGNYATLNPLAGVQTLANGNLDFTSVNTDSHRPATIAMTTGKWYCEFTASSAQGVPGLVAAGFTGTYPGSTATSWGWYGGGNLYNSGSPFLSAAFTAGDVVQLAFDADSGKLWFGKNGAWLSSGNPAAGTNQTATPGVGTWFFVAGGSSAGSVTLNANFGQRPFAYAAPSGFKALCDTSLPAPTIARPSTVMDVKLYTGNGSTQTISGLGFSPDLVWLKSRTNPASYYFHWLFDTVRSSNKGLSSNDSMAEQTFTASLNSFDTSGFTVGVDMSQSTIPYVAWTWDAGSSTVTNTAGSISSQVRANASAGFSVVTYTGNGVQGATVGHGLGVAPSMVIYKSRDGSLDWLVYHSALGATQGIYLNQTLAAITSANFFNNTAPNSTTLYLNSAPPAGQTNTNGNRHLAYCFAPVAGYSSFGVVTATGTSDGGFAYTGFRPRFLLYKNASGTGNWGIYDSARDPENVCDNLLLPSASNAEFTSVEFDFLSNGIKLRYPYTNGHQIVFAAFAEVPFQYARAR